MEGALMFLVFLVIRGERHLPGGVIGVKQMMGFLRKGTDQEVFVQPLHRRIFTVSYTHLDVYKRQDPGPLCRRYGGKNGSHFGFVHGQRDSGGIPPPLSFGCLLYTSRCV